MNKPEVLNFSIGGFSEDYEKVIWQNDKLYHFFERSFLKEDYIIIMVQDSLKKEVEGFIRGEFYPKHE